MSLSDCCAHCAGMLADTDRRHIRKVQPDFPDAGIAFDHLSCDSEGLAGQLIEFLCQFLASRRIGWQWNNPSIPFIDTVVALKPVWMVRFMSGIIIFSGIVLFMFNILSTAIGSKRTVISAATVNA
jgi:hypothetical protein